MDVVQEMTLNDAEKHCQNALHNNMYGGIIYCYTNNLNGKRYIGQTLYPVNRHDAHSKAKENSVFHHAIRKYGFQNFSYHVLEALIANSREEISSLLDSAERKYIEELSSRTTQHGYNVQEGGTYYTGYGDKIEKPVDMYSLSGEYIRTFDSIILANQFCGISGCGVRKVCNHEQHTAGGYIWTWKGELVVVPEIKQIGCYDLEGKFIKAYDNPFQACKSIGKRSGSIQKAIKDRYRIAYGCYWRDYVADVIPITDFPKAIFAYDLEGNLVQGYRTLQEAIDGVQASGASAICAAISRKNSYRGLLWRKEYHAKINPFEDRSVGNIVIRATFPNGEIKYYSSIKAASLDIRIPIFRIRASFNKKTPEWGILFERVGKLTDVEVGNLISVNDVSDQSPVKPGKIDVAVDQYTEDGKFIQTFRNLAEASRYIGASVAGGLCRGHMVGGYIWCKHGTSPSNKLLTRRQKMEVHQYDSEGNYVATYPNIQLAAWAIGMTAGNHLGVCLKEHWRQAKGFYWRREKCDKIQIPICKKQ